MTTIQSQASHASEATPTITIEAPSDKAKPEEPAGDPPTEELMSTPSSDSGLPSQSPSSVATQSASNISDSSYSSNAVTSNSSHNMEDSPTTGAETGGVGVAGSNEELGVQSSPSLGDMTVESSSDNDVIASAAQIKVTESAEAADPHSPIPAAQSGSHSPIPLSGTGNLTVSISTEVKPLPCESVPACELDLEPGELRGGDY